MVRPEFSAITELSVGTGADFAYLEIGAAPTAETVGQRIRIPARVPEYFAANRGADKVAGKAGSVSDVTPNPVSQACTVIRVIYDDVAGTVEVAEMW